MSFDTENSKLFETQLKNADEDGLIKHTQNIRLTIIDALTNKGTMIPEGKNLRPFLEVLRDIDTTALGNKKIKSEEKGNDLDRQTALMIAEITSKVNNSNITNNNNVNNKDIVAELEKNLHLPTVNIDPKQMTIGIETEEHSHFIQRMEKK